MKGQGGILKNSAKECAFIAVFSALLIAVQFALSFVPGVELVTVLLVSYSFAMGWKRGMLSATVFSILRQLVFGFYPLVLILYMVYFNFLVACFGLLGKVIKRVGAFLPLIVVIACVCTAIFTITDNILTPLWYGYGAKATRLYFTASLTFMIPQVICTAVSVTVLFFPLYKIFQLLKDKLN